MKKIYEWEPWFFMFFGLFHLHRIWGLIDRTSYADFWIGILESKGIFYFVLMGILAFLCVCGIATCRCKNYLDKYKALKTFSYVERLKATETLNFLNICQ